MTANIQHLRTATKQERPNPNVLLEGQLMLNIDSEEPGLYFKTRNNEVIKVGPVAITSDGNPPNNNGTNDGNAIGELWLDRRNNLGSPVLKVYTGTNTWQTVGGFEVDDTTGYFSLENKLTLGSSLTIEGQGKDSYLQLPIGSNADEAQDGIERHKGRIRFNTTENKFRGFAGGNNWVDLGNPNGGPLDLTNLTVSGTTILCTDKNSYLSVGGISVSGSNVFHGNVIIGDDGNDKMVVKSKAEFPLGIDITERNSIRFHENDVSSNYIGLGLPSPGSLLSSSIEYKLPVNEGSAGQILQLAADKRQLVWGTAGDLKTLNGGLNIPDDLAVNGSTTLGNLCTDSLTVNATSTFNCNVTFNSGASSPFVTIKSPLNLEETVSVRNTELRFFDKDDSDYVGFKSPDVVNTSLVWILPQQDAPNPKKGGKLAMVSDGSGQLGWEEVDKTDLSIKKLTVTNSTNEPTVIGTDLRVNGPSTFNNSVTLADTNNFIAGGPSTFKENITVIGTGKELRFQPSNSSTKYVGFESPDSIEDGDSVSWKLPAKDGDLNQVLSTNGNGQLSWKDKTDPVSDPNFSNLTVTGNSTLNGKITGGGGADITGLTEVDGLTVGNSLTVKQTAEFEGDLTLKTGHKIIFEKPGSGNNNVAFKASGDLNNNLEWTWPTKYATRPADLTDGAKFQCLSDDGAGNLSWKSIPSLKLQELDWDQNLVPERNAERDIGERKKRINTVYAVKGVFDEIETNKIDLIEPKPNLLNNGNFDVWERGRYTDLGAFKSGEPEYTYDSNKIRNNAVNFGPDRWFVSVNGVNSGITITRKKHVRTNTSVQGNPVYYMEVKIGQYTTPPSNYDNTFIGQRLDNVTTLAGKTITVSFMAKGTGTIPGVSIFQNFKDSRSPNRLTRGTLSPSSSVKNKQLDGSWRQHIYTVDIPQVPSNTSIGEGDYLELRIHIPHNNTDGERKIELAAVKLENSSSATAYVSKPIAQEQFECGRFFQVHSFWDTSDSTGGDTHKIEFSPELRKKPTLEFFSPYRQGSSSRIDWNNPRYQKEINSRTLILRVDSLAGVDRNPGNIARVEADAELN